MQYFDIQYSFQPQQDTDHPKSLFNQLKLKLLKVCVHQCDNIQPCLSIAVQRENCLKTNKREVQI
ncbi:CLUMA_CG005617, isoform A [Clunio marinus]|uniref:CLUMA_CG005617, isoform A n=1 Tax=Clunio marinus TaxID=568069 RepID=A0A1J1HVJ2_9DIPT|nr:CLUMA_CG005617, isoform A [Clunio marinus]